MYKIILKKIEAFGEGKEIDRECLNDEHNSSGS